LAGSPAFEAVLAALASAEGMDRWTARGTLQLALMDAGLDSAKASPTQLRVVVERLLPRQLQSQPGVNVSSICERLSNVLALEPDQAEDPGLA
jgi:hypothetical protein